MGIPLTFSLGFGSAFLGVTTFAAQLIDTSGADIGDSITTGFVETGGGWYLWYYNNFETGFRGAVNFYDTSDPDQTILITIALNPADFFDFSDIKTPIVITAGETPKDSPSVVSTTAGVTSGGSGNDNITITVGTTRG